jgi:hypothetical protein
MEATSIIVMGRAGTCVAVSTSESMYEVEPSKSTAQYGPILRDPKIGLLTPTPCDKNELPDVLALFSQIENADPSDCPCIPIVRQS